LATGSIYNLTQVDYSAHGQIVEIVVDGVPKPQTVIFSGLDCFGETYYFTEEGLRYITDSRHDRPRQKFVLHYLDKIPKTMKNPMQFGHNLKEPDNFIYFQKYAIKEHRHKNELLAVVLKKSNINVVWNFYWIEDGKVPSHIEILQRFK
jgi:hypothetical protein